MTEPSVPTVTPPTEDKDKHWLVRRSTIRGMWVVGFILLGSAAFSDIWLHDHADWHPYFFFDAIFGFYSVYGLVACAAMVLFAKFLGLFLKRKDTYYDE